MDSNFWRERWQRNEIGFHRASTHPALESHWATVGSSASAEPVLVPLCGKSLDMHWLARQGHPVVGVELDRGAIEAFFDESGVTPTIDESGPMPSWSAGRITLFAGDFFEFNPPDRFSLVYDRAALIALRAEMRARYLDHLASLMKPDARGLLVTLEYPQDRMHGPPFAVMPDELHSHPAFGFKCLQRSDVLASHEPFAEQGLPWLREAVYAIRLS
ncbi:MAG: thiopurine S-methyltransferase [Wenzhouxiangellaceae bacterium]